MGRKRRPRTEDGGQSLAFLPLGSSGAKLSHDNSLERDRRGLWEFLERGGGDGGGSFALLA